MKRKLTDEQRRRLAELVAEVNESTKSYRQGAESILAIYEEGLWAEDGSFPAFVQREWPRCKATIYERKKWAEVVKSLEEGNDPSAAADSAEPYDYDGVSLRMVRQLAPLSPEKRRHLFSVARKLEPDAEITAESLRRAKQVAFQPVGSRRDDCHLTLGDFRNYPPEPGRAKLILTDPPFGADWLPHWSDLGRWAEAALMPGGYFCCYCPTLFLPTVLESLAESLEFIWVIARTQRYDGAFIDRLEGRTRWQPIAIFGKPIEVAGKPEIVPPKMCDVLPAGPQERDLFEWQQSTDEAERLISRLTVEGDEVLDCCMATGTVGEAAGRLGRAFRGWEIDEGRFRIAAQRLGQDARPDSWG